MTMATIPTKSVPFSKPLPTAFPARRRIVVFQPHRYTRTQALIDEFARCFYQSDVLLLTEIYAASEKPIPGISGELLAKRIAAHGHHDLHFCPTLEETVAKLRAW